MNLLEGLVNELIYVDFGGTMVYGTNIIPNTDFTIQKYTTLTFPLMSTRALNLIADRIRVRQKHKVIYMHDMPIDECDVNGSYQFFITINNVLGKTNCESSIDFIVCSEDADDNNQTYHIGLSVYEKSVVIACLDQQCIKYLGKTCKELLAKSDHASVAE